MRRTRTPLIDSAAPETRQAWTRELAQPFADDVVLAAALFKPNAAGNHALSWCGFGQRQLLTARGAYLGERVVVAVTALDVHAIELALLDYVRRPIRRWSRTNLAVSRVLPHGRAQGSTWPALLIGDRRGGNPSEIQPLRLDPETERVVELLLQGHHVDGRRGRPY